MKNRWALLIKHIITFIHYRGLLGLLVQRDLSCEKYRRSFLGYLWSILDPLLTMVIMAMVFSLMFRRNIEYFPAYLISGNILLGFMRESSSHSLTSITGNAALFKKRKLQVQVAEDK